MENHSILDKFSGTDPDTDPELWLKQFERYAILKDWAADVRWKHFPLWLCGEAQRWYETVSDAIRNNTNNLKAAFHDRFRPHESIKWQRFEQFQNCKQKSGESVEQ
jgi:hypothetical protein